MTVGPEQTSGAGTHTKSFNKKDALIKLNFDNLPVVGETKLKKQLKALVFSFHLRGRAVRFRLSLSVLPTMPSWTDFVTSMYE